MADGNKTEKATPKRRRDERKKGNVFLSQDAVSVVTLVVACAMLWTMAPKMAENLTYFLHLCMQTSTGGEGLVGVMPELLTQGIAVVARTVLPLLVLTALSAVAATMAQTRLLVSGELLKPKFSRINPLEGFKRLFSLRSIVEALKGILKIAVLVVIIYMSLRDSFLESSKYLYTDVPTACAHLMDVAKSMVLRIIVAFVVIAAADYGYQWWNYERQLRMSKQEIKEEYKQVEGDPQIKGKIRQLQRSRAQSRMMQQVPQADVVVRNPTHYAVALRYRPEKDSAPVVLAKGRDELALRIVRVAEENGVAVMENVPLARALYAEAELNANIPTSLYEAVAEVLVYIFRLNEDKKIVK